MLASLYVTLAVAYALLQGITNRIILSFGDVASFGAVAAFTAAVWALFQGMETGGVYLVALLSGLVAAAALGRVLQAMVFAPLTAARGQSVMIASIGVSIVLMEVLRLSTHGRDLWLPPLYDAGLRFGAGSYPVTLGYHQIWAMATATAALAVVLLVMGATRAGRFWRAVSQNAAMASLCGVDTRAVFAWSFVAASALAALSGWIVTMAYGGVSFAMGLVLGFKAMFAAIIGGFGRVEGAIAGGLCLAALETLWTATSPMVWRDVAVFGLIVLVLILKPEGLLGQPLHRESEV